MGKKMTPEKAEKLIRKINWEAHKRRVNEHMREFEENCERAEAKARADAKNHVVYK